MHIQIQLVVPFDTCFLTLWNKCWTNCWGAKYSIWHCPQTIFYKYKTYNYHLNKHQPCIHNTELHNTPSLVNNTCRQFIALKNMSESSSKCINTIFTYVVNRNCRMDRWKWECKEMILTIAGNLSITPFSKISSLNSFKKELNPDQNSFLEYKKVDEETRGFSVERGASSNISNCKIFSQISKKN